MSNEGLSQDQRKWVVFFLLNLGLVPLIVVRAESVYSGDYMPFLGVTTLLFLLSVALALGAGWGLCGKSMGRNNEKGDEPKLLDFLRFFLLRYFVGEALRSIYGLYIFVLFAVTLTAWLPDGFENGNVPFILASVLYFLSSVFFTAWVYGPPERKGSDVEVLVFPLSIPNWTPEDLDPQKDPRVCEKLCRNEGTRNIVVPLLAHLARHPTIRTVVFLVTDTVYNGARSFPGLKTEEGREYIRALVKVIETCRFCWSNCIKTGAELTKSKTFNCGGFDWDIKWDDLEDDDVGIDLPNDGKNGLTVRFVRIGKANNLHEIKRRINRAFSKIEDKNSSKVLFDITGGTAVVSAAIILEAIKGDYRAGYVALPQGTVGVEEARKKLKSNGINPPEELVDKCPIAGMVEEIPISVFSFEDIANELQKYFERAYGGR
ncbi:hypothetical protein [Thermococcus henrietii]|uniref:hypothetical protein n=1 Tax=Thermococcus henrietii TaxID=2016361 RepID=UPI0011AB8D9E|nr:hypothetical protein [Thermococcus henrietii]